MMSNFIKYPKIFRVGHKKVQGIFNEGTITIEEKMDGANVRFMYDSKQEKLRYGSRKRELSDTPESELGQFKKFVEFIKQINIHDLEPDFIYYAEYMIPHTIQYDWHKVPLLLGFDVYDTTVGKFISEDLAKIYFSDIGIDFVPIIDKVKAKNITKELLEDIIPESRYYNGKAEGVVFKNYYTQQFAKLVAEEFKEVNAQIFGKGAKQAKKESPELYIIEKYIPPRRIEKVIQNLINEGYNLDMSLMNILPKAVWQDVIEEEAVNILNENITLDLRKLRKMIPKKCVNVLQRMMMLKEVGAF